MQKIRSLIAPIFLILLFAFFPFEHKFDKLFRFYSLTLIPPGLSLANFNPKIYFYASDILGLIFFVWGVWQVHKRYTEKGTLFLAILFGTATFSLLFSPFANYPVAYTRLLQLFTPLALYFFLAHSPIPKERLFKIIGWSLFWAGLAQALIAIAQYFAQHNLGLRLIGEQPLCAVISVPGGHRWLFDQWFGRVVQSDVVWRAMGTMPHPNPLGGLFVLTLMITSYFFYLCKNRRPLLACAYFIQFFALGITYSRSAIFAYILGTAVWFAWMRWRQKIVLHSTAALILVSGAITGALLHEQIVCRGGIVNYTKLSRDSDTVRIFYQNLAFHMVEKHPLIGVGYGQFTIRMNSFLPAKVQPMQASTNVVHSVYLMLAAENGLLSLFAFLGWIGWMLAAAWRSAPPSPETGLLVGMVFAFLFISGCDFYPIFFQQGKLMFFGMAGLLARYGFSKRCPAIS